MEFKELIDKNELELKKLLEDNKEKVRELRFKDSNKQLKDVREIRRARQLVARILTLLNKKK